jgi:HEAT repeat protein
VLGCSPPQEHYIPRLPDPPREDPIQRIRRELESIRESGGVARTAAAEKFFNLVRERRGDPDSPAREELQALGPEILKTLSGIRDDPFTRRMLVGAIGLCRHPEGVAALIEMAEREPDPAVLDALGVSRDPRAAGVLTKLSGAASPLVRKFAAFNLAALRVPDTVASIQARLEDEAEEVRWGAALGLAYFHSNPAGLIVLARMLDRDHLKKFIPPENPNSEILAQRTILSAVQALRILGHPAAIGPLREAERADPSDTVKEACREAIRHLENR